MAASVSSPKDPRGKAKYNIFSRIFLLWADPLLWLGFRRRLTQDDLYVHPQEADSGRMLRNFNIYWKKELEKRAKPRLLLILLQCLLWPFLLQGFLSVFKIAVLVGQSVLLGYLSEYFAEEDPSDTETRDAYLFAFGLVACSLLVMVLHAHSFLIAHKVGMMARTLMTAVIYQKVLTLNQVDIGRLSIGHVINLASNDVQRFETAFLHPHILWIAPIHLGVTAYLIYIDLGWSSLVVLAVIVLQVPLQVMLAKAFSKYRFRSAVVTDQRVRIMNEIISGIRVIKMYAWEYAFKNVVAKLRRFESILILKGGIIRAINLAFMIMSTSIISFILFSVYASTGETLTSKKVFTSLALLYVLRLTSVHHLILNVVGFSEAHVALTRINRFLCTKDVSGKLSNEESPHSNPQVVVKNLSAAWNSDDEKTVLKNISFEVDTSRPLLSIVGHVGAGKSTLLQCLLGELEPKEGTVELHGKVSYASQEAWLFSDSLRENILFGKPYDPQWYQTVVKACALDEDIHQLANGDLTLVGERGVTLSGGQKARVSLARAVYHDADIYLLDDPLSAVDAAVAKHLFDECIRGVLKDHVVILVTHQVQFVLQSNNILGLKEGNIEVYGSYDELLANGVDTKKLLGLIDDNSDDVRTVTGTDDPCLTARYLSSGSSSQLSVNVQPTSFNTLSDSISSASKSLEEQPEFTVSLPPEETGHGSLSTKTYFHYFRAGGNVLVHLFIVLVFIAGEGSVVVSDWWLSDWAQCSPQNLSTMNLTISNSFMTCFLSVEQRIGTYAGITVGLIILNLMRAILLYSICVNASRVLHNRMFSSLLRAPVLFFDNNPIGRILNRFSKDVGYLDDLLPYTFCEYMLWFFRSLSILVTSVIAIPWIVVPCALMLLLFVVLRFYYLQSAREVKRLEAIARSPVYSHISASLQGLSTIRAYEKEDMSMKNFHSYQDQHTQSYYLYHVLSRWLGLRADLLSSAFFAVFVFSAVGLSADYDTALLGLALVYTQSLTNMLQYVTKQSAEVENIMISAERILDYAKLESEAPFETPPSTTPPDPSWPNKGHLSFKNVGFQYSPNLPLVLKNLDFTIQPAEKVGVVGRTGAGKSSLLSVLYRLAEPFGLITIDDVDIKTIGLHDLRSKMSIIPQDPVLFSGTMRYNLDPFNELLDSDLWDVLEQVQLKVAVEQLEGQLGGEVSEGGSNFSVGQKQLVCLARALMRKNRILILDEATANVDLRTDDIIQQALRVSFAHCTVITIAHRINTIMDSDKILVMDRGELREMGSPYDLLQDSSSLFSELVNKTGPITSQRLRQLALESENDRDGENILFCSTL